MSTVDCLPVGLNSVQLIGYSGSDPLKGSADNQPTKFSLATTQYYQSREGRRKLCQSLASKSQVFFLN